MATITFLFVDQVDSTRQLAAHGELGVAPIRDALFRLLRTTISDHHGEVLEHTGDGVVATFTGASDAVAAAMAMQHGAAQLDDVHLRVGLNTGEPSVDGEGRWFGMPIVIAARLCAQANADETLASAIVQALAADTAEFSLVGDLELKGVGRPVRTYRVSGAEPSATLVLPVTADLPLVGRDEELALLAARWDTASQGERGLVFLTGEAGAGKSRLAAEFLRRRPDATALVGRCDEGIGAPFQPFVEMLRAHVATAGPTRLGQSPHELTRLLPDLPTGGREALASDPGTERQVLFDAVRSWLRDASGARPLVLVLDDLHWATEPTLLLLLHVLRDPDPARLLVVATYRDTDLDDAPLGRSLADLLRLPNTTTVELGGLDVSAVAALAGGNEVDPVELTARTGGNPLFVTELLIHPGQGAVPTTVTSLLTQRVARLPAGAADVLAVAALAGPEFPLALVDEAMEGRADVVGALEAATRSRLLAETDDGDHRFTHALVRDALAGGLSHARRGQLHGRLASAARRLDRPAIEIARHLVATGDPRLLGEAAHATLVAGREAFAGLAFEAAAAILREGLGALPAGHPARAALLLELGELHRAMRRADLALPLVREAAELTEHDGDPQVLARAAIALAGWYNGGGLDLVEGKRLLLIAEQRLSGGDSALRARVMAASALDYEDPVRSRRLVDEATAMAERSGDAEAIGFVAQSAYMEQFAALPQDWEAFLRRRDAMRTRVPPGHLELVVTEPVLAIHELTLWGDPRRLAGTAEQLRDIADRHHLVTPRAHASIIDATLALLEGRVDEAEAHWNEAAARAGTDQFTQLMVFARLFWLRHHQGRLDELEFLLTSGAIPRPADPVQAAGLDAHVAVALAALGRDDAEDHTIETTRQLGRNGFWNQAMSAAAVAAAECGCRPAAEQLVALLTPWSGYNAYVVHAAWQGPIDMLLGDLLLVLDRPADALAAHDRALAELEAFGLPTPLARVQLGRARAFAALGDDRGPATAAEAQRLAQTAQLPIVAEAARAIVV